MEAVRASVGPATAKTAPGELMKVGVVTYLKGEGAKPHYHPNEEQFYLVLEGRRYVIVGDEERVVEPGDLVHIPEHGRSTAASSSMRQAHVLRVKSPSGDGSLAIRITTTRPTPRR